MYDIMNGVMNYVMTEVMGNVMYYVTNDENWNT